MMWTCLAESIAADSLYATRKGGTAEACKEAARLSMLNISNGVFLRVTCRCKVFVRFTITSIRYEKGVPDF